MSDPPFLLVINSDLETLDRVASELERRYKPDYEVARATSAQEPPPPPSVWPSINEALH